MFAATAEALMWTVVLDDWYSQDHPAQYEEMKTGMKSLLLGLRWARNRSLHDFALLTGFVPPRWPSRSGDGGIYPGWQHRDLLPVPEGRYGEKQYDARVAGHALLDPIDEVAKWFEGWVEIELKRPTGEDATQGRVAADSSARASAPHHTVSDPRPT